VTELFTRLPGQIDYQSLSEAERLKTLAAAIADSNLPTSNTPICRRRRARPWRCST